jgi:hypothetical protein
MGTPGTEFSRRNAEALEGSRVGALPKGRRDSTRGRASPHKVLNRRLPGTTQRVVGLSRNGYHQPLTTETLGENHTLWPFAGAACLTSAVAAIARREKL